MTTIKLTTEINAPIQAVFDLNRNIDIHKQSTSKSNETAIAGVTSGLINKNETVTWRGKHFGFYLTHKSIISEMKIPHYFVDEMMEGRFKKFKHQHFFKQENEKTIMFDVIEYETSFGIAGRFFDYILLNIIISSFFANIQFYIRIYFMYSNYYQKNPKISF